MFTVCLKKGRQGKERRVFCEEGKGRLPLYWENACDKNLRRCSIARKYYSKAGV